MMLKDLIKIAIDNINAEGELQYIIGENGNFQWIDLKKENEILEEVVLDLDAIRNISVTNKTLILYENDLMTIITAEDWNKYAIG